MRPKITQKLFGTHLLLFEELHDEFGPPVFYREEILTLIKIAKDPRTLTLLQKEFKRLYLREPDKTLSALVAIRGLLARWRSNQDGFAKLWLRNNSAAADPNIQDGQLSIMMSKEAGFNIPTASVTTARQELRKADKALLLHEHPLYLEYMRTGRGCEELEQFAQRHGYQLPLQALAFRNKSAE